MLWILGEVVPLSTKDGKPDRLVAAFSDITQRKEAEESLHQLSARLLRANFHDALGVDRRVRARVSGPTAIDQTKPMICAALSAKCR